MAQWRRLSRFRAENLVLSAALVLESKGFYCKLTLMLQVKWWNRGLPKDWWACREYSGADAIAEVTLDPWKHFWVCSVTACCLMKVNYFGSTKKTFTLIRHYVTHSCKNRSKIRTTTTKTATRTAKNKKQNSNFAHSNSLLKMENVELTLVLLGDILANDKCLHTGKISLRQESYYGSCLRASFPCLLNHRGLEGVTLILCSIQLERFSYDLEKWFP